VDINECECFQYYKGDNCSDFYCLNCSKICQPNNLCSERAEVIALSTVFSVLGVSLIVFLSIGVAVAVIIVLIVVIRRIRFIREKKYYLKMGELKDNLIEMDTFNINEINLNEINIKDIEFLKKKNGTNIILGKGSFSVVYLGEYKGKKVALKCFKEINMNIKHEIQISKKLDHVNIIKYYGTVYDEVNENFYLITEFAERGTLKEWINENDLAFPKSLKNKIEILKEISKGNINK
jgi:hypothetical protein